MILNLFRNSQPPVLILAPLLMLGVWISAWSGEGIVVVRNPMPLYHLLLHSMEYFPIWFPAFLGYCLTLSQAAHLNYLLNKHEVLYKNSYLPALFYILFAGLIPQFLSFHPVIIVNSILIFVIDKLLRIYKHPSPLPLIFDSGFLIGLASLFFLPAITFFLLFAGSILILKTFSWRDWFVGLFGLLLPYFFTFIYYFWIGELQQLKDRLWFTDIRQIWDTGGLILQGYRITIIVVALLFILTILRIRANFYKNVTRVRNFQQVIFIFLLVALFSLAIGGSDLLYRFSILVIPISTMISYYFLATKKAWWAETLFWLLAGTLLLNHISNLM